MSGFWGFADHHPIVALLCVSVLVVVGAFVTVFVAVTFSASSGASKGKRSVGGGTVPGTIRIVTPRSEPKAPEKAH